MVADINIMVGGEAGQGVQSVGLLVARALARCGYSVFADQDYESRIRGGHNFFRIRANHSPVGAISEKIDILIALNKESIDLHRGEVVKQGLIIYDSDKVHDISAPNLFSLAGEKLAQDAAGDKLMANTVLLAGALASMGFDLKILVELLRGYYKGDAGEKNIKAARAGYDYVSQHPPAFFTRSITALTGPKRLLLSGNDAMALGALAAGCRFMAAYPMTPTTGIMEYLAGKQQEFDIVVVPAEDEIAAMIMTVGAAYAGVRAMTATSGGGFCLMVEGLGLAAMTETPVVVIEGTRPGPAIGLPTRTEQGDLEFVLHAAHGEFARAVLTPATIEDCFWSIPKAFNLAEKYQLPVLVLTDHHLASSYQTVDNFDLQKVTLDRGELYAGGKDKEYKRHAFTGSGVSPRAFPGKTKALVVTDSDEHDEAGHLTEDAGTRTMMMRKRLSKVNGLKSEISSPRLLGQTRAETLIIGWGSTFGAMKEAVDHLDKEGKSVNMLHINEIWPFPAETVAAHMNNARNVFVIENNATGQLARLIRRETGKQVTGNILKFDGRPFTPELVIAGLKEEGVKW